MTFARLEFLRLFKRLRSLEERAVALERKVEDLTPFKEKLEAIELSFHACRDCGGLFSLKHPLVKVTEVEKDTYEARCKWDQAAYERSPLAKQRKRKMEQADREH